MHLLYKYTKTSLFRLFIHFVNILETLIKMDTHEAGIKYSSCLCAANPGGNAYVHV